MKVGPCSCPQTLRTGPSETNFRSSDGSSGSSEPTRGCTDGRKHGTPNGHGRPRLDTRVAGHATSGEAGTAVNSTAACASHAPPRDVGPGADRAADDGRAPV